MAIIKCKMCGGDLEIIEGSSVCECAYCGTRQTVPSADNEKKLTLFARAGRLLRACEFDKASGVFETIVADFPEEAEAYWGLVLCKYGIEYVDDPATGKKIPTCHRSSFDSVMKDANFEQACENTDAVARRVYRDEARAIEELRKGIIEVSDKEEPYDVFISYKEKDQNGERTQDSVIAQEIYRELSREGYRVFFSRISLENRLGTEYEPYIFAALNSAKVMIVVGTDYENFDAVWVKNEWSRFLKLIAKGERKTLIPVFRDMDAYDMPEEFNKLTALDMGKVGAMQDLVHGVEKIVGKKKADPAPAAQPVYAPQPSGPNVAALLKRGQQALDDCDWEKAKSFFEQVLSMDAENAEAFFGLFLAGEKCANEKVYIERVSSRVGGTEMLSVPVSQKRISEMVNKYNFEGYFTANDVQKLLEYDLSYPSGLRMQNKIAAQEKGNIQNDRNLTRAFRYAKGVFAERLNTFKDQLFSSLDQIVEQNREKENIAREAKIAAYESFLVRAEKTLQEKNEHAKAQKAIDYQDLCRHIAEAKTIAEFSDARNMLAFRFSGHKDSAEQSKLCSEEIARLEKEAADRTAARTKKRKKAGLSAAILTVVVIAAVLIVTKVVIPNKNYNNALSLMAEGRYEEAIAAFEALEGYRDSGEQTEIARNESLYSTAKSLLENGQVEQAVDLFLSIADYKDSQDIVYETACNLFEQENYQLSLSIFLQIKPYKDSHSYISQIQHSPKYLKTIPVGGTIQFGTKTWIVLKVEKNRMLVITESCFGYNAYNEEETNVTWETSSIRAYLNGTFYEANFSDKEKSMILTVTLTNNDNPRYGTDGGKNTEDKVFLLSIEEAESLFESKKARALDRYWWLRSPGENNKCAAIIGNYGDYSGAISYDGIGVQFGTAGTRPAIWISLG